jgi:hypothetical protein
MSLLYTLQDLGEQDKAIRSHQEPIMGTAEDRFSERIAIGFTAGDRQRESRTRLCFRREPKPEVGSYPRQFNTGRAGYFLKLTSVKLSSQR